MLRLVADENFDWNILRNLETRRLEFDVVHVREVGLGATDDRAILDWAAREGRILLTHDASTMLGYAYERLRNGQPMPGLCMIPELLPVAAAAADLALLLEYTDANEWEGQVRHLPLH